MSFLDFNSFIPGESGVEDPSKHYMCLHTITQMLAASGETSSLEVMCHRFFQNPQAKHQLWQNFHIFFPDMKISQLMSMIITLLLKST